MVTEIKTIESMLFFEPDLLTPRYSSSKFRLRFFDLLLAILRVDVVYYFYYDYNRVKKVHVLCEIYLNQYTNYT